MYGFGVVYLGLSRSDEVIKSKVKEIVDMHDVTLLIVNDEKNTIQYEYNEEAKKKDE